MNASASGRRDGSTHGAHDGFDRDHPPVTRRNGPQALARKDVGASPASAASSSPAWKTCWHSTKCLRMSVDRWCVLTKPRVSSSAKRGSRSPPSPAGASVTTTSTSGTARRTSSCSSTSTDLGGTRRSRTNARELTSRTACANSSTSITPKPSASASSSTTCRRLVSELWSISRLGRSWALNPGRMLLRNNLIDAANQENLWNFLEDFDYKALALLGDGDPKIEDLFPVDSNG